MNLDAAIKEAESALKLWYSGTDVEPQHIHIRLALLRFVKAWDESKRNSLVPIENARAAVDEALKGGA